MVEQTLGEFLDAALMLSLKGHIPRGGDDRSHANPVLELGSCANVQDFHTAFNRELELLFDA